MPEYKNKLIKLFFNLKAIYKLEWAILSQFVIYDYEPVYYR